MPTEWSATTHLELSHALAGYQSLNGGEGQIAQLTVELPVGAHAERVVASFGMAVRQYTDAPLENIGHPVVWRAELFHRRPFHYPEHQWTEESLIHRQDGALALTVAHGLVPYTGWRRIAEQPYMEPTDWLSPATLLHWSGRIDTVNTPRSDGALGVDEGAHAYWLNVTLSSGIPYQEMWPVAAPEVSSQGSLRVLYRLPD